MSTACIARTLAAAISSSGDVCSTAVFAPPLIPEASPSEDISKEEEAGAKNEPRVKVSPAAAAAATSSAF